MTFGIGSAASTITNFYVRAAVSAVAHGTFQGGMTAISGGKFWSGFASGALSSIAASAWSGGGPNSNYHGAGSFAKSGAGMIAFGTVSGGAGAALTGGNFWQGAVTGLVVSGLNHYAHSMGFRKDIVARLKSAGIDDPYAAASYEGLDLEEFALKVFSDMYNDINSPCIEKVDYLDDGAEGETPVRQMTFKGKTTYSLNGPIKIAKIAFSSYMKLASALGHELIHVDNVINGNMSKWFDSYKSEEYRKAMSELSSIKWEINNNGMPNLTLYNHYYNVFLSFNN